MNQEEQGKREEAAHVAASVLSGIVMRVLDLCLHKPERYHHICGGGSSAILIDEFTDSQEYQCRRQGKEEHGAPRCKECTGLTADKASLTDRAEAQNYAMNELAQEIVKELSA